MVSENWTPYFLYRRNKLRKYRDYKRHYEARATHQGLHHSPGAECGLLVHSDKGFNEPEARIVEV